jgi:hypothetical protein
VRLSSKKRLSNRGAFPCVRKKGGIYFSEHRALLTKVERHTHVNEVGKSSSNLRLWWLPMAAMVVGVVLAARAQSLASGCNTSLDQVRLANPLARFAQVINFDQTLSVDTIVLQVAGVGP